ncbi:FAD-linked oxidase-like protein [Leptotrombidium deliense]|uniref:FAD-linked oxidase-like protein n=1 Tax=Leptotrombidium deliense TaxID=299467 RepID=A0A443SBL9_9ACAR|nr:FAD-linked oxidase-like protein [Leptotrombidium deliense]
MTAVVGSGNSVKNIVENLEKLHNVSIGAGVVYYVGIGGLALGGGWSFFSRQHGLLTQNIVEMNVVTADGEILTTNNKQNTDLFAALRGAGGGNFGVVTHFQINAFYANHTLIFLEMSVSIDNFVEIFEKWQQFVFLENLSTSGVIFFTRDIIGIHVVINNYDVEKSREYSKKVSDLFMVPGMTVDVYEYNFTSMYNHFQRYLGDFQGLQKAKSFFVNRILNRNEIERMFLSLKKNLKQFENIVVECVQFGGMIRNLRKHSSYIHNDANYIFEIYSFENETFADSSIAAVNKIMLELSFFSTFYSYQNVVDDDLSIASYYGHKLPFLMHMKCKYDSENLFTFNQSIPLPYYCIENKCNKQSIRNMYWQS